MNQTNTNTTITQIRNLLATKERQLSELQVQRRQVLGYAEELGRKIAELVGLPGKPLEVKQVTLGKTPNRRHSYTVSPVKRDKRLEFYIQDVVRGRKTPFTPIEVASLLKGKLKTNSRRFSDCCAVALASHPRLFKRIERGLYVAR